jgi:hypothetical protein
MQSWKGVGNLCYATEGLNVMRRFRRRSCCLCSAAETDNIGVLIVEYKMDKDSQMKKKKIESLILRKNKVNQQRN